MTGRDPLRISPRLIVGDTRPRSANAMGRMPRGTIRQAPEWFGSSIGVALAVNSRTPPRLWATHLSAHQQYQYLVPLLLRTLTWPSNSRSIQGRARYRSNTSASPAWCYGPYRLVPIMVKPPKLQPSRHSHQRKLVRTQRGLIRQCRGPAVFLNDLLPGGHKRSLNS
jgi:hypothetical protein